MTCQICGAPIPPERLEIIPGCTTCVKHSTETRKTVFMDYSHKTAGTLVIVGTDKEQIRLATRVYRRSR